MNKKYQEEKSEKINKKITTGRESKQREKKEKRIACADCGGDLNSGEAANDHLCSRVYH